MHARAGGQRCVRETCSRCSARFSERWDKVLGLALASELSSFLKEGRTPLVSGKLLAFCDLRSAWLSVWFLHCYNWSSARSIGLRFWTRLSLICPKGPTNLVRGAFLLQVNTCY